MLYEEPQALSALSEALVLAEPEGYTGIYLEYFEEYNRSTVSFTVHTRDRIHGAEMRTLPFPFTAARESQFAQG